MNRSSLVKRDGPKSSISVWKTDKVVYFFDCRRGRDLLTWTHQGFSVFLSFLFAQVFNKRTFTKNYLVQNLVDKLDDLECLAPCPPPSKPSKMDGKCEHHGEELKLYCQTDKRLICVVCRESRAHRFVVVCFFTNLVKQWSLINNMPRKED